MPPALRSELLACQGLLPLVAASLGLERCATVLCSDASPAGFGVHSAVILQRFREAKETVEREHVHQLKSKFVSHVLKKIWGLCRRVDPVKR